MIIKLNQIIKTNKNTIIKLMIRKVITFFFQSFSILRYVVVGIVHLLPILPLHIRKQLFIWCFVFYFSYPLTFRFLNAVLYWVFW